MNNYTNLGYLWVLVMPYRLCTTVWCLRQNMVTVTSGINPNTPLDKIMTATHAQYSVSFERILPERLLAAGVTSRFFF